MTVFNEIKTGLNEAISLEKNKTDVSQKSINIREEAVSILDCFEELLDEKGIMIPSDDRDDDNEDEACIFGTEYYDLEDRVSEILTSLCIEILKNPGIKIYKDFGRTETLDINNTAD